MEYILQLPTKLGRKYHNTNTPYMDGYLPFYHGHRIFKPKQIYLQRNIYFLFASYNDIHWQFGKGAVYVREFQTIYRNSISSLVEGVFICYPC